MKCSLGICNFLEEISSLSHSIVFFYFFALITEGGFLNSLCYSLELCIQMGISFLFYFAFHLSSSQLFVRPSQTTVLPFSSLLFTSVCKASSESHFAFYISVFCRDDLDHCLMYNVTNSCSQFFRHSV